MFQIPNTKYQTPNSKFQVSGFEIRHPTSKIQNPKSKKSIGLRMDFLGNVFVTLLVKF